MAERTAPSGGGVGCRHPTQRRCAGADQRSAVPGPGSEIPDQRHPFGFGTEVPKHRQFI